MNFIVELYLDGYDTEEEMNVACREFIYEQLNFAASGVTITEMEETMPVTRDELAEDIAGAFFATTKELFDFLFSKYKIERKS